ncbi:Reverse transcriptase domain-containing protein, partial [Aphis craccivora]
VQNRFLSYSTFILKIDHPPHDYLSVGTSINIPTLASRRVDADLSFITSLLNSSIDVPDLLSSISLRVRYIYPYKLFQGLIYILTYRTQNNKKMSCFDNWLI